MSDNFFEKLLTNTLFLISWLLLPSSVLVGYYYQTHQYLGVVDIAKYFACQVSFLFLYLYLGKKINKKVFFLILTPIYYLIVFLEYLILEYFRVSDGLLLSFNLISNNWSELFTTISATNLSDLGAELIFIFTTFLSLTVGAVGFSKVKFNKVSIFKWYFAIIFFILVIVTFPSIMMGDTIHLNRLLAQSEVYKTYNNFYSDYLNNPKYYDLGDVDRKPNIFFMHLESVNASLVNKSNTPGLLESGRTGVIYRHVQGTTMQTIRAQEAILCNTPPSFDSYLSKNLKVLEKMDCLPKILKRMGYKTYFFQDFPDLKYYQTGSFAKTVGFDEVHSGDIMDEKDLLLPWGVSNDEFYTHVWDYLDKHAHKPFFAYVAVSSANHYPFYNENFKRLLPGFLDRWPHVKPVNNVQKMENSLFLQDYFFKVFFWSVYKERYIQDSDLYVFGDHSWPTGLHVNNIFNISGGFQENFVTTAVVVPSLDDKSFKRGVEEDRLVDQNDLFFTVIKMLAPNANLPNSINMFNSLVGENYGKEERCFVSIQPYGNKYLSMINFPFKILINVTYNKYSVFNIQDDPNEKRPLVEDKPIELDMIEVVKKCLNSYRR